jgi:hypothetical protein
MIKLIYSVEIWYLEIFEDADYRGAYQKFLTHTQPPNNPYKGVNFQNAYVEKF